MRSSVVALLFVCAGSFGLAGQTSAPAVPAINVRAIDAHLRYLADDLLEGRAPATRGGRLAARYIAAQFQAYGLDPVTADTSYFLPVALIGTTPRATLTLAAGTSAGTSLRFGDDFVAWAERPDTLIKADAEVVFVGYGINAPESQWDDYKGMNLTGKILLMLVNDPGLQDSSLFRGKELTYYGRW